MMHNSIGFRKNRRTTDVTHTISLVATKHKVATYVLGIHRLGNDSINREVLWLKLLTVEMSTPYV